MGPAYRGPASRFLIARARPSANLLYWLCPEPDCIRRHKVPVGDLSRTEILFAEDRGSVHRLQPQRVHHHVVGMQAQQKIGIDRVVADLAALGLVKTRKISAASVAIDAYIVSASPRNPMDPPA